MTAETEVIARWPRVRSRTRFALAAAPDGSIYVASSGSAGGHVAVRLSIHGGRASLVGFARGLRPILAGAARANRIGLSLGIVERDGRAGVVGHRAVEMDRRGGFDDCF